MTCLALIDENMRFYWVFSVFFVMYSAGEFSDRGDGGGGTAILHFSV